MTAVNSAMPPIISHDWANEARRTFQEFKSYESLFATLNDRKPEPPKIKFEESFRIHRDVAELLRREIYVADNIPAASVPGSLGGAGRVEVQSDRGEDRAEPVVQVAAQSTSLPPPAATPLLMTTAPLGAP